MPDDSLYKRTLLKVSFSSDALAKTREMTVYLPPGYNELTTYPVLYGQDGSELIHFGRAATTANRLILEEGAEPFIIVGAHVDMPNRSAEYSPDGTRFEAYLNFFAEEMLPYIEAKFPVRQLPEERVLVGDSLGGTVSLHLALAYPSLFRKVISLSGAFFDLSKAAVRSSSDLSGLQIFQLIGTEETAVKTEWGTLNFLEDNREMRSLLEARKAALHYRESGGTHIWGFWQKELPEAMRYFFG